jgi:ankyrin repeat protein
LLHAVTSGHESIARQLLDAGADANVRAPRGMTALDLATALDDDAMQRTLTCYGAKTSYELAAEAETKDGGGTTDGAASASEDEP